MAEDPEQAGDGARADAEGDESPGVEPATGDERVAGAGNAPDGQSGVGESNDRDVDESDDRDVDEPDDRDVGESSNRNGGDTEGVANQESADAGQASAGEPDDGVSGPVDDVPGDVRKYERFKKMDGAQYDRVNDFLRDRTYITAREWAIARLCADFRTETGVEMTKIGENLPELVPFMTDTYTPQAVNQARSSFEDKVRKSGATFLYGAMCGFFTAEELDEMMYDVTEIAKFLLEVEGVDLSVEDELEAEERISSVMREVREASDEFRQHEAETESAADSVDDG